MSVTQCLYVKMFTGDFTQEITHCCCGMPECSKNQPVSRNLLARNIWAERKSYFFGININTRICCSMELRETRTRVSNSLKVRRNLVLTFTRSTCLRENLAK